MFVKIALRNLLLYRKKSLGALLSIVIAFVSLSLFEAYMHDVQSMFEATFSQRQMFADVLIERDGTENPGRTGLDNESMNVTEQAWIESYVETQKESVQARVRFLNIYGYIANGNTKSIFAGLAYDVKEGAAVRGSKYGWNTYAGVPLDQANDPAPIIIGKGLAAVFSCTTHSAGPQLNGVVGYSSIARPFDCPEQLAQLQVNTESNQSNAMDFKIQGLIASGMSGVDEHLVMIPLDLAHKLFNTQLVSYMSISMKKGTAIDAWIETFNARASGDHLKIKAQRWQQHEMGRMFVDSIDFLAIFRNFVISIILVVVTMAILNTFIKIVHERTREIGTLRSIGFRPSFVISIFVFEALFLALSGGVIGVIASFAGQAMCNSMGLAYKAGFLSEKVPFHVTINPADFIWITGLVSVLTVVSTLAACVKTTRQPIAEIMADH
ncbi:MAG: ABC transporter permease [Chitinophagaceae bacterium]|nr:ABC transporter permease [Oligoflexus sp.]